MVNFILTMAVVILFGLQVGCEQMPSIEQPVTLAVAVLPMSAPIYVAHDLKFFQEEGLKVSLRPFWTGKEALDSMIRGEAQFCTVAETPLIFSLLNGKELMVIATIANSSTFTHIIGRKDKNIRGPHDLRGKRIGVNFRTSGQYFLYSYLIAHGIPEGSIRQVDLKPEEMAEALMQGKIDAAISWDPHLTSQQLLLGSNAVILDDRTVYKIWWNLVAGQDYTHRHPDEVKKLLRALLRAEAFIRNNSAEAAAIVTAHVGKGHENLDAFDFHVQLSQSLLLDLEEQARWAMEKNMTEPGQLPNFLHFFYPQGLEAVAPHSIMLLHR